MEQADAIGVLLAEAQDAAGAHADAGVADVAEGGQALVVRARRDDRRIELAARVDVVVVGRQARGLELARLLAVDHAECHAHLHAHVAHAGDHGRDVAQAVLAPPHVAPRGPHAEPRAAVVPGGARRGQHRLDALGLLGLEPRPLLVPRRLRAVLAVLGAAARLDVHQRAQLHFGGGVEAAVQCSLGRDGTM